VSRIPDPPSDFEAEGIPDPGEVLSSKEITGDAQEGEPVPGDRPIESTEFGMTAYEERHGESLTGRLAREEPDVLTDESIAEPPSSDDQNPDTPYGQDRGVGRIVDDDEGAREDQTAEVIAHDVGTDLGGYSSEETAMHIDPDS
jgi:hypothetical protein